MTFSHIVTKSFLIALIALFAVPAFAAEKLTAKAAQQFVNSLPDVNTMGKEMRDSGKADVLNAKTQPNPGETFEPYAKGVEVLKNEFPDDYKKFSSIAKSNGFSSAEEWGKTGDQVMLAYMATQTNIPADAMAQMDAEMMAQMPPEMQAKMKRGMAMVEMIAAVPAENKAIVTPLIPSINEFIGHTASAGESQ